jgi:hypothetical protein
MDQTINNTVKLYNPNNKQEYIQFTFEKSLLEFYCNVSIELQLANELLSPEKWSVHMNEFLKIANWYKSMSGGKASEQVDLVIPEINLSFTNYYFEKGDGVYYLSYRSEFGKLFKFHFWEQIGNSNVFIYKQFMECLQNCK